MHCSHLLLVARTLLRGLHQLLVVRKNGCLRDGTSQALLFHPDIVQQLINFGLHDCHLGAIPAELLRELMSHCTPSELGELLTPSIVAIVAAVGGIHTGAVANAALDVVQQQLDPLARLKLKVSMLFHNAKWIRIEAAETLRSDYSSIVGPIDEAVESDPFQLDEWLFCRLRPQEPQIEQGLTTPIFARLSSISTISVGLTITTIGCRAAAVFLPRELRLRCGVPRRHLDNHLERT